MITTCVVCCAVAAFKGYFLSPVVITGVSDDSRLMKEEIFGPVTCVVPFNDEQEVKHSRPRLSSKFWNGRIRLQCNPTVGLFDIAILPNFRMADMAMSKPIPFSDILRPPRQLTSP